MDIKDAYNILNKNRKDFKMKGESGELIALSITKEFQKKVDCIILHSYKYRYVTNDYGVPYEGNIKLEDGEFIGITDASYTDEIDLLIITKYRVFVVEVKARSGRWLIEDHWIKQNGKKEDKSPLAQDEKHCRHLYHHCYEYLPLGHENYIVPVVLFVDRADILDKRCPDMRVYIPVEIANRYLDFLIEHNSPLKYAINTERLLEFLLNNGECDGIYK